MIRLRLLPVQPKMSRDRSMKNINIETNLKLGIQLLSIVLRRGNVWCGIKVTD